MTNIPKNIEFQQSWKFPSLSLPINLKPVLVEINHMNDLGLSRWHEVVYFDEKWKSYNGSKTFEDGEQVVKWKYCKDC